MIPVEVRLAFALFFACRAIGRARQGRWSVPIMLAAGGLLLQAYAQTAWGVGR